MRLATFRRSRFCVFETLSVFRCLFVPSQVHYLPLAGESVPSTMVRGWMVRIRLPEMRFQRRHVRHGMTDVDIIVRELGFNNCPTSPCTQDSQNNEIHVFSCFPLYEHATVPFEFPRQVSPCPRGSCSLPLPCFTGIPETPTRRT